MTLNGNSVNDVYVKITRKAEELGFTVREIIIEESDDTGVEHLHFRATVTLPPDVAMADMIHSRRRFFWLASAVSTHRLIFAQNPLLGVRADFGILHDDLEVCVLLYWPNDHPHPEAVFN